MATAKKTATKTTAATASKAAVAAKTGVAQKAPTATKAAPLKKAAPLNKAVAVKPAPAAKKSAAVKAVTATAPARPLAKAAVPSKLGAALKPIKTVFNKTGLIAHLAELAVVEAKAVKAVMASLEATMLASVHKKGLGSFTLPGLLKVNVVNVPAKKKRTGVDPFTKVERMFAAKPASVKIKTRALKKLKDAAA